jgi:uncharacterized protein YgiM (DUF1202 family)
MSRRSIRISILAAALSAAAPLVAPVAAFAQAEPDAAVKEVENSKFSTRGIVTSNAVYVRCGPGDNYYPTMKLDKDAPVRVVGAKFDWLKIVPPDGSFCYVAKLYVERHGDGKLGRVTKDSINVRAGSSLSALKIGILCELNQGEEVEILGDEQEYFRIKPPAKAFLYVNKKFVQPDPEAKPEIQITKTEAPKPVEQPKPEAAKPEPTKVAEAPKSAEQLSLNPQTNTPGADFEPTSPKPDAPKPEAPKVDVPPAKPEVTTPVSPTIETPRPEAPKPEMPKPEPIPAPVPPVETPRPENPGIDAIDPTKPAQPARPQVETPQPEAPKVETPKVEAPPVVEAPKPQPPKVIETPKVVEAPKPVAPPRPAFPVPATPEAAETAFEKAETVFTATRGQNLDQQPLDSLVGQYEALNKSEALPESLRRIADARLRTVKTRQSAQADLFKARQGMDELNRRRQTLAAESAELQRRISENTVRIYQAVGTLQPSSLQQGKGVLYRLTDPATGRTVCYLRSNDPTQTTQVGQFVGVKGQITEDTRLGAKVLIPSEVTVCDPGKVHQTITAQIIPPSLMPKEPAQATTTEPAAQQ